jgi:IMP cyclohydrolase
MIADIAAKNMAELQANPYPGRGIVIGENHLGQFIQIYWVMGRSENSRNRVLVGEDDLIRTAPYDPSKVKDPSLIIYNAMKTVGNQHIVSNGAQTDTVAEYLVRGTGTFEDALATWSHEPDPPNNTPRISGLLDSTSGAFVLSKIVADPVDPSASVWTTYRYVSTRPGYGLCFHTYVGDGNPLPSFDRDPYLVRLTGTPAEIASTYWRLLDEQNRVALVVKAIQRATSQVEYRIINRLGG